LKPIHSLSGSKILASSRREMKADSLREEGARLLRVHLGEEHLRADLQPARDADDVHEGDVALAAFDAADIGAVQAADQRQAFLRNAGRRAQRAEALAESFLDDGLVRVHGGICREAMPMGPRTIGITTSPNSRFQAHALLASLSYDDYKHPDYKYLKDAR
jgi:hypothetical protein